jgi:7,8-dihydropterin-6-yl-methyl-4-(beta-D-ribofuranosyl)aminobenzene 5'-phosphate synthase
MRRGLPLIGLALLVACRAEPVAAPEPIPTAQPTAAETGPTEAIEPEATATVVEAPAGVSPAATAAAVEKEGEAVTAAEDVLTITVVYDNYVHDSRLTTAWGFSALIEYRGQTLLWDTGGDGPTLLGNMDILGIDPAQIERVALSHPHGDHTGGLEGLLATGARPEVYLIPAFSAHFREAVGRITTVTEVEAGQALADGMYTTGQMSGPPGEHALVIETGRGLVIVTGCAHPGIAQIVARAKELFGGPVYLVMGGFHLGSKSEAQIKAILEDFRAMGVEKAGPCHCTGDQAIAMFAEEYGEDFVPVGVGSVIEVGE